MGPVCRGAEGRGSKSVWTVTVPPAVTAPRARLYSVTVVRLKISDCRLMMI